MDNYPLKRPKSPTEAALDTISFEASICDPQGMYTGVPIDENDEPVQDADDL